MRGNSFRHQLWVRSPLRRAALDVRENERHGRCRHFRRVPVIAGITPEELHEDQPTTEGYEKEETKKRPQKRGKAHSKVQRLAVDQRLRRGWLDHRDRRVQNAGHRPHRNARRAVVHGTAVQRQAARRNALAAVERAVVHIIHAQRNVSVEEVRKCLCI
ncbi:hypothetical protein, conserved in T. vivax [Trypanosoma vivax Y486]|uniref:Uncharacterized protein n=1 Tax=Trypanosoma vivax (strain Y486) TaxID=1055687 RepID=F9WR05_TRYVY|nr:hypothetical protein, conserved in T. vivax [Trypanosoma vivax Y486]|eukprot:CCD19988.1 hypothetical protein, conserved in T. vivax [Trypanosoma vivax Y486]